MKWQLKAVISIALVAVVFASLAIGKRNCDFNNGDYVRGLFWMKCINEGDIHESPELLG